MYMIYIHTLIHYLDLLQYFSDNDIIEKINGNLKLIIKIKEKQSSYPTTNRSLKIIHNAIQFAPYTMLCVPHLFTSD